MTRKGFGYGIGASKNIDDTRGREHYCCSDEEKPREETQMQKLAHQITRTSRCVVGKR